CAASTRHRSPVSAARPWLARDSWEELLDDPMVTCHGVKHEGPASAPADRSKPDGATLTWAGARCHGAPHDR
ncbi:MAG: hypothetical protein AB7I09_20680, partial [Planctomycetota bacterium]